MADVVAMVFMLIKTLFFYFPPQPPGGTHILDCILIYFKVCQVYEFKFRNLVFAAGTFFIYLNFIYFDKNYENAFSGHAAMP